MKNLKKVLSLVLALAMALSLMTVAFAKDASDFNDYDDVTYTEAVDVMTAIGVFNGGDGNNFAPNATLTREQAAKIITYMMMGQKEADKLTTTIAPYADVAANRWSAGAIAWCSEKGILAGIGGGKFAPTAQLTGLEFAKMLLVALGYDAKIEKLEGSSWAINTATLAINIGLDDDMDISLSKALTREEAAQMAFNAMKADTVDYADRGTDIKLSDGTSILVGASKAEPVTTTKSWGNNIYDETTTVVTTYTVQFAEQYCRDLTLNGNATTDSFGRPAHTWKYDGDKVGTYVDDVVLTYTTAVKGTDLYNDVDDAGYEFAENASVKVAYNGNVVTVPYATVKSALESSDKLGGNGIVIELYANSKNEITNVVGVITYVGEVTKVTKDNASTNADERALTVSYTDIPGNTASLKLTADDTKGFDAVYAAVAKGDKVLVTPKNDRPVNGNPALTVAIPETVTGMATTKSTKDGTITVDGTVYEAAATIASTNNVANFTVSSKYDATLYLDENGYVVYAKSGAASVSDKAVLVLKGYKGLNADGHIVDMIKGVTSDGEAVTWQASAPYTSIAGQGLVRKYSETDDNYTLTTFGDTVSKTDGVVDDGQTVLATGKTISDSDKTITVDSTKLYFKSDVKFIFSNSDKYTVKEGVQKVTSSDIWVVIDTIDEVPFVSTVFVNAAASNTTTSANDIVFVDASSKTADGYSLTDKDGKVQTFDTYDAYIAGEKLPLFYTKDAVAADGFYEVEVDNDNGDYKLTGNTYGAGDNGALSVSNEETYTALVGDILSGSNDYDISGAEFIDVTGNDYDSFADVKSDITDGTLTSTKVKFMVVYDYDTGVASYVYLTAVK